MRYRHEMKLVAPNNKRKYKIIVVGTGLAGASAAATLAELGYDVHAFTFHDSPRRAHSIAAQGGINAAKNYQNDGDSIERLFMDTIKGGDFRAREANVHRLAEVSVNIIDQCVAQGVPFNREYGGMLSNRSFGGAQVSRTFYCRGQTGQQLLIGAYSALARMIGLGKVKMHTRTEFLDLVVANGKAVGVVVRHLVTGNIESHNADAVVLATGGYSNAFFLSTNAAGCNVTATWRAYKRGAAFANPCFTQIHPTCIPVAGDYQRKLTLMSESLRNDGRIWVPKKAGDKRKPDQIPDDERDYYLERLYPSYGNLAPRDISSRAAKRVCDEGRGVGESGRGVYLDFADAIRDPKRGRDYVREKYGNLFDMYHHITNEDPYSVPMRIYPALHYTMGGLWVDYNLMSNVPGLFVIGEANFSDHGANRLGASALMQGLADGYFILPYTLGQHLASTPKATVPTSHEAFKQAEEQVSGLVKHLVGINGKQPPSYYHKKLGQLLWDHCGMARTEKSLKHCLETIPQIREEFWKNVKVTGTASELNQTLEYAGRVADFLEFGELLARDALTRNESCGGHFREEFQYEDGEARRDDANFMHAACWEYTGLGQVPNRHVEPLIYEEVKPTVRSYK